MIRTRLLYAAIVAVATASATLAAPAPGGGAAPGFILTSASFEDGGFAPTRLAYTKTPQSLSAITSRDLSTISRQSQAIEPNTSPVRQWE